MDWLRVLHLYSDACEKRYYEVQLQAKLAGARFKRFR